MKIQLDTAKCIGLGLCESLAPDHFEIQDDSTLLVTKGVVSEADSESVRAAVAACPTAALSLVSCKTDD
jgi:ferredoxin